MSRSRGCPRHIPVGPPPFQQFLDEHRDEVWRFLVASVGRQGADDCFQETFLAALRAYPRLPPDANRRAWVLTIAHRKAIDSHRARRRRPVPVEPGDQPDGAAPAAPHDAELWDAVRALAPKQRAAVVLRFVAGMRHAEAAAVMDCSEEAARRNLHAALSNLRNGYRPG